MECLIWKFNALLEAQKHSDGSVSGLDRNQFKVVLHNLFEMTDDFIMDRGTISHKPKYYIVKFATSVLLLEKCLQFIKPSQSSGYLTRTMMDLSLWKNGSRDCLFIFGALWTNRRNASSPQHVPSCFLSTTSHTNEGMHTYLAHKACLFSPPADCFHMYDLKGSGFITRDDIFLLLKDSFHLRLEEEGREDDYQDEQDEINELMEIVLKKMVRCCPPICLCHIWIDVDCKNFVLMCADLFW